MFLPEHAPPAAQVKIEGYTNRREPPGHAPPPASSTPSGRKRVAPARCDEPRRLSVTAGKMFSVWEAYEVCSPRNAKSAGGTSGSAPGSRTGPGRLTAGPGGHLGTAPRHLGIVFVPRAPARRRTSPRKAGTGAPRKDDLTAEPRNRDATNVGPYRGMGGPGRPGTTTSPQNLEIGTRRTSDLTAECGDRGAPEGRPQRRT